jgi:hypothetical protein
LLPKPNHIFQRQKYPSKHDPTNKTHNYNMLEGSILVALIFKIHCKAMFYAFYSKQKFQSQKSETLLIQTNFSRLNIVVPKFIQWKDITLLEE